MGGVGGFGGCVWGLGRVLGVVVCVFGLVVLFWRVCRGFTRLNTRYFEILNTYISNNTFYKKNNTGEM